MSMSSGILLLLLLIMAYLASFGECQSGLEEQRYENALLVGLMKHLLYSSTIFGNRCKLILVHEGRKSFVVKPENS